MARLRPASILLAVGLLASAGCGRSAIPGASTRDGGARADSIGIEDDFPGAPDAVPRDGPPVPPTNDAFPRQDSSLRPDGLGGTFDLGGPSDGGASFDFGFPPD